jgi:hypothetical protein
VLHAEYLNRWLHHADVFSPLECIATMLLQFLIPESYMVLELLQFWYLKVTWYLKRIHFSEFTDSIPNRCNMNPWVFFGYLDVMRLGNHRDSHVYIDHVTFIRTTYRDLWKLKTMDPENFRLWREWERREPCFLLAMLIIDLDLDVIYFWAFHGGLCMVEEKQRFLCTKR